MKTNKMKLLATMVTLAAVIVSTAIPATAQRRQSKTNKTETRVQKSDSRRNSGRTTKQSDSRKFESKKSASKSTVNRNSNSSRKSNDISRSSVNKSSRSQQQKINRENRSFSNRGTTNSRYSSPKYKDAARNTQAGKERNSSVNRQVERNRNSSSAVKSNRNDRSPSGREKSATYRSNSTRNTHNNNVRRTTGINSREKYRLDTNDKRYTPNRDYRGSKQVWNKSRRPGNMNYNNRDRGYYKNYNYSNHKHWDRSWERYRWNFYSWRDYYHGYNPYSYRYHRHYYHHPVYGHVIRRFVYSPSIFVYNHNRYYCYDGHFFRFFRGIGYVLVDVPFGVVFDALPHEYERVYINGYLYFRVGNLFFEFTDLGFRLVHYPERYYSFDDGYRNDGYYFEDDLYY
ncbi:hypothetical protein GM418_04115 [Maribellus comscasis]|uniref:Uncharacterized protein n=1 Tax=Maribellus comscasis TaxID=2681766 RepID=A0A6I6JP83_9BACT|nr:hypothetical protein [Maribellus comscasis]QGY42868.1 hypothetical protein GM418_04115 [Maribellus comscasis]